MASFVPFRLSPSHHQFLIPSSSSIRHHLHLKSFIQTQKNPVSSSQRPLPLLVSKINSRTTANDFTTEAETQKLDSREEDQEEEEEVVGWGVKEDPDLGLPERWREIHGSCDWQGLLEPLDPLLRKELIRYGEMAQACYDVFDFDPFSRYCGSSKYNRRHFFEEVGMPDSGYEVTRYLYATSNINLPNFFRKSVLPKIWSSRANFIGYVAVSDDLSRFGRRDIAVAWRGTVTKLEWLADLMDFLQSVRLKGHHNPSPDIKVESGFLDLYTDKDPDCRFCRFSAREQILAEIKQQVDSHAGSGEEMSISITGHSLGSALAILSAFDIAEMGLNKLPDGRVVPITVFSFSGPRVGNRKFKERCDQLGVKVLRVVNVHDTVPKVPGIFLNERLPNVLHRVADALPWGYTHVGTELRLDHTISPFLKETTDPTCFHNLEAHLHLLDGYHGTGRRFVLSSGRDPALVNKSCDFLKDHLMVPPFWRQDQNKGMVRSPDGRWIQPERSRIDEHPPDTGDHLKAIKLHPD